MPNHPVVFLSLINLPKIDIIGRSLGSEAVKWQTIKQATSCWVGVIAQKSAEWRTSGFGVQIAVSI